MSLPLTRSTDETECRDRRTRLLSARDPGDETGDEMLDLFRRQIVAGLRVRLPEIAADNKRPQPSPGEPFRLRHAQSTHDLHRRGVADALEESTGDVTEIVLLDQRRVGAPCVRLQVNADAVHTRVEHATRDVDSLRGRALM